MKQYFLTVFSPEGEKLIDDHFQASGDEDAKSIAEKKLEENSYTNHTMRLTSEGKLILFHR